MNKIDGAHIPGLTDRMVALHNEMFELIARAANLVVEAQRERDKLQAQVEELKAVIRNVEGDGEIKSLCPGCGGLHWHSESCWIWQMWCVLKEGDHNA